MSDGGRAAKDGEEGQLKRKRREKDGGESEWEEGREIVKLVLHVTRLSLECDECTWKRATIRSFLRGWERE
jgi:hypothetical protein